MRYRSVGGSGAFAAMITAESLLTADSPTALTATTLNLYALPLFAFDNVYDVAVPRFTFTRLKLAKLID